MKIIKKFLIILSFPLFIPSCSFISYVGQDAKGINITSEPKGAYLYVDGWIAKTPVNLKLKGKDRNKIIKFRKEGYKETQVKIDSNFRFGTTLIGNMVWVFFYPLVVWGDLQEGYAWGLDKNIKVELEKLPEKND